MFDESSAVWSRLKHKTITQAGQSMVDTADLSPVFD